MIGESRSGSIPLTNESGSRRPKNLGIRRIRIRIGNTVHNYREDLLGYLERGTWWSHDWRGAPASSWCPGSLRERSDAPGIKHYINYNRIRGTKWPPDPRSGVVFDPLDPDPGWEKIWIRDPRKKHPGSATLEMTLKKPCELVVDSK